MGEEKERSKFGEEMEPTSLWPGLVGRGRSFALGEDVGPVFKGQGAQGAGSRGGGCRGLPARGSDANRPRGRLAPGWAVSRRLTTVLTLGTTRRQRRGHGARGDGDRDCPGGTLVPGRTEGEPPFKIPHLQTGCKRGGAGRVRGGLPAGQA